MTKDEKHGIYLFPATTSDVTMTYVVCRIPSPDETLPFAGFALFLSDTLSFSLATTLALAHTHWLLLPRALARVLQGEVSDTQLAMADEQAIKKHPEDDSTGDKKEALDCKPFC